MMYLTPKVPIRAVQYTGDNALEVVGFLERETNYFVDTWDESPSRDVLQVDVETVSDGECSAVIRKGMIVVVIDLGEELDDHVFIMPSNTLEECWDISECEPK